MTRPPQCQHNFFVNLHAPYDLAFIQVQEREYTYDKGGRLLWIIEGEKKIERSLSNKFVEKWDLGEEFIYRRSRVLPDSEIRSVIEQLRQEMVTIAVKLKQQPHCRKHCNVYKHEQEITAFLKKVLAWDYSKLRRDGRHYSGIYSPIEIFPTDIPHPLIIQLTQGCAYNKCTFCGFYKDKSFSVKSIDELGTHLVEVKDFLGNSLANMRNIFLADANALMIEQPLLLEMFDLINQEFHLQNSYINDNHFSSTSRACDLNRFEGIYSFLDAQYGQRKTVDDFVALKHRHLKKVYIGLETGSDELLQFVHKCNKVEDVIGLVSIIKQAGLKVGIMLIAGLGGDTFSDEHVGATVHAVNRMDIDGYDSIHFSHLTLFNNASYKDDTARAGIKLLSYADENRQIEEMVQKFVFKQHGYPQIKGYEVQHVRF